MSTGSAMSEHLVVANGGGGSDVQKVMETKWKEWKIKCEKTSR